MYRLAGGSGWETAVAGSVIAAWLDAFYKTFVIYPANLNVGKIHAGCVVGGLIKALGPD
jgi:hypothetical protein